MPRLTTTSSGVLGIRARRPWSAHEISTEIRYLSHCIGPRPETRMYREIRSKVGAGVRGAAVTRREP